MYVEYPINLFKSNTCLSGSQMNIKTQHGIGITEFYKGSEMYDRDSVFCARLRHQFWQHCLNKSVECKQNIQPSRDCYSMVL